MICRRSVVLLWSISQNLQNSSTSFSLLKNHLQSSQYPTLGRISGFRFTFHWHFMYCTVRKQSTIIKICPTWNTAHTLVLPSYERKKFLKKKVGLSLELRNEKFWSLCWKRVLSLDATLASKLLLQPALYMPVAFVGVATWFRDGSATHPSAARVISTQTPMWWTANGVYW